MLHISDTHGTFPELPAGGDVIIHSGDLMPNKTRGNREVEPAFQAEWLHRNANRFRELLNGRTMLLCRANHDFATGAQSILQGSGVNVVDITNRLYQFDGLTFYGFPYVNYQCGEWNFEVTGGEMADKVEAIPWADIDVMVAHSPIAGILDECYGDHIGSRAMAHALSYMVPRKQWPKAYLHGHAHEARGLDRLDGMLVSNAATAVWEHEI